MHVVTAGIPNQEMEKPRAVPACMRQALSILVTWLMMWRTFLSTSATVPYYTPVNNDVKINRLHAL